MRTTYLESGLLLNDTQVQGRDGDLTRYLLAGRQKTEIPILRILINPMVFYCILYSVGTVPIHIERLTVSV